VTRWDDRLGIALMLAGGLAQLVLWPHRTLRMLRGGDWEPDRGEGTE
jgi:hypothetical protein